MLLERIGERRSGKIVDEVMEKMPKSDVNYKPTDLRSPTKPKHMTQEKKKTYKSAL